MHSTNPTPALPPASAAADARAFTAAAPWALEFKVRGGRRWRLRMVGAHRFGRGFASPTEAWQALCGDTRYPHERVRNTLTGEVVS